MTDTHALRLAAALLVGLWTGGVAAAVKARCAMSLEGDRHCACFQLPRSFLGE
jgi:hypothetical protein